MAKKFRVELSKMKRENYVFFCPDAPIHLNLCQPVGYVDRLTSSLLRGIRGKTVIDCDNLVGSVENIAPVIEELKNTVNNDAKKVTLTYKVVNELEQKLTHEVTLNKKKTTKTPSESKGVFTLEVTGLIEGKNTITLHVSDEFETVNSEEIVVNITPVNVAPKINELSHQVNNDAKEVTLTYKVVDDPSQTITHQVTLNGSKSTITPNNQGGTYTHKVTGLIVGTNTIKLHVSDGKLTTDSQQISVEITEVSSDEEVVSEKAKPKTRRKKKEE